MSIVHKCRHCNHVIGKLNQQDFHTSQLGFNVLSKLEKQEMIQYLSNGEVHIKTICENCEALLEQRPEYHELDFFIQ